MMKIKFVVLIIAQLMLFKHSFAEIPTTSVPTLAHPDPTLQYSNLHDTAIIQALNKITAKTSLLEIKTGTSIDFGKLTIFAHKCWKSSPDQRPEDKILLEVFDRNGKSGSKREKLFHGWMFSSSPSISDLEHPIYDITAIGCK